MLVRTDDQARNLRYPWKGPASAPFGFEVRFSVVGIFLGLMVSGWILAAFLAPNFKIGAALFALIGVGAFFATRKIAPHLTPDTPLRYYIELAKQEYRTPRPPKRT